SFASFRTPVTYTDMFFGEWNQDKTKYFMENTHLPISIMVTAAYLMMVRFGPKFMEHRKAFDLRSSLTAWNMALFAYSALSLVILVPHLMKTMYKGGVIRTICNTDDLYTNPISGFYGWLFCMSKGPELIDTVYLILRKRPVIFMHWYHHSVTFLFGQIFYTSFVPWARWGVIINLGVHTVIYYALRAWGVKTDRWVSKLITCTQSLSLQITQFASMFYFAGVLMNEYSTKGLHDCDLMLDKMGLGFVIVCSYLYLFCQYFHNTYIQNNSLTRPK
ncbi:hypothetical protein PENTCL1PPCAC_17132, partial [Pristionchus entomophagus]